MSPAAGADDDFSVVRVGRSCVAAQKHCGALPKAGFDYDGDVYNDYSVVVEVGR